MLGGVPQDLPKTPFLPPNPLPTPRESITYSRYIVTRQAGELQGNNCRSYKVATVNNNKKNERAPVTQSRAFGRTGTRLAWNRRWKAVQWKRVGLARVQKSRIGGGGWQGEK